MAGGRYWKNTEEAGGRPGASFGCALGLVWFEQFIFSDQ